MTDLGLAINRNYSTDDGDKREETTFIDITFWGRQAETLGQYMKKGRPLYVEGRLQLDSWDDKNTGQKRSKLKVVGDNFQFLGGRDDNAGGGGGSYQGGQQAAADNQGSSANEGGGSNQGGSANEGGGGYEAPPSGGGGSSAAPAMDDDDIPF